jgi:hypothetical protein
MNGLIFAYTAKPPIGTFCYATITSTMISRAERYDHELSLYHDLSCGKQVSQKTAFCERIGLFSRCIFFAVIIKIFGRLYDYGNK